MLLYLNVLVLLLLQPALSSPKPLTTPSRGCPTCRGKPTQSQPPVDLNATTLAVGEPCGVYTLSCAHGLRCAPPEDDPRPLRTLLEGRGVCSNTSSISPTEKSLAVGKGPTLCLEEDGNERVSSAFSVLYRWGSQRLEFQHQNSPFADLFVSFWQPFISHWINKSINLPVTWLWVCDSQEKKQRDTPVFTNYNAAVIGRGSETSQLVRWNATTMKIIISFDFSFVQGFIVFISAIS